MEGCSVLVTGGLGFIGSHTVVPLLLQGCKVCVMDNLSNASAKVGERIKKLAGDDKFANLRVETLDICDAEGTERLLKEVKFDACIHFAGYKAVGESVEKPLLYYQEYSPRYSPRCSRRSAPLPLTRAQVNVQGTLNLIECMRDAGCRNIVFSSSATVYVRAIHTPRSRRDTGRDVSRDVIRYPKRSM